jgi:transposase
MLEPYAGKFARTVLRGGRSGDAVALPDFKPGSNVEPIEVLTQPEQRRRRSVEEKLAIVRETFEPGATVSGVARRHQVNAN